MIFLKFSWRSWRLGGFVRLAAALICFIAPAAAWNDTGHMVVAEIAWRHLDAQTKARVEPLVALGASPRNNTFVTAACWADDLKREEVDFYNSWHFIDLSWSIDGTPAPTVPQINIVWALEKCRDTLQSPKAPDIEKARALRFLIHLVGDIHQPLHCISLYSQQLPRGDRGGNLFKISGEPEDNLHWFWDNGGGAFRFSVFRPLTDRGQKELAKLADQCEAETPIAKTDDTDFYRWAQESYQLAKTTVYSDIEMDHSPTQQYSLRAQTVARQRVSLAGRRLAEILNGM